MSDPDWDALADQIVNRTLRVQPGERVIYLADPYVLPKLFEAVRLAVLRAGGIEHATTVNWTERLTAVRDREGKHPDPAAALRENEAMLDLFRPAQVFIWLPGNYALRGSTTTMQSEWVLARWPGRGVHFHWFPDLASGSGSEVTLRLYAAYQHAILDLDRADLRARQERIVAAVRGKTLRVRTPDGTDLSVTLERDGWYHLNDGDASPDKVRNARCARDREEELPAGAIRTLPIADSAEGTIRYRRGQGVAGRSVDLNAFTGDLELIFRAGHLVEANAGSRTGELRAAWDAQTGDKDRLSEIVIGSNPLLPLTIDGARMPVYWGFGAGGFRFHLGDIVESGGTFASSFSAELWFTDATVEAEGVTIIRDGTLLIT